jgi:hypothetical protein
MNDELVTAAEFGDHTQAVVARMHLEEAGIPAFLSDEWMSQGLFVYWEVRPAESDFRSPPRVWMRPSG